MLSIHGQKNPYMSDCKTFFKTKQDLQLHFNSCETCTNKTSSNEEMTSEKVRLKFKLNSLINSLNILEIPQRRSCNAC